MTAILTQRMLGLTKMGVVVKLHCLSFVTCLEGFGLLPCLLGKVELLSG
jgi:hypothetical protein